MIALRWGCNIGYGGAGGAEEGGIYLPGVYFRHRQKLKRIFGL